MSTVGRLVIDLTAGTVNFDAPIDRSSGKLRDFGNEAERQKARLRLLGDTTRQTGEAFEQLGSHGVTNVQAVSASLRTLEGGMTNNLRAAERFVANFLGLGRLAQSLFPIAGGLAFLGVVGELGKKAYELYQAFQKLQEAPLRMKQAFADLNQPLAVANDELRLTNDRLEADIAKLQGKVAGNGLVTALDEARVYADKLAESLNKDLEALEKLLKEQRVGFFAQLLGKAPTDDIAKEIQTFHQAINEVTEKGASQIPLASTKPGLFGIHVVPDVKGANQANAATFEEIRKRYADEITKLQGELKEATQSSLDLTGTGSGAFLADAETRANAIRGTIESLRKEFDEASEKYRNTGLTQKKSGLKGSAAAEDLTRPYENKLHELDAQLSGLKQQLSSIGQGPTAETLAKSMAKAKEEVAKLNDELKKLNVHPLTQEQTKTLTDYYTKIGNTQAEVEWKTKFEQTTTSIRDRIQSLKLLTSAIGQGYEAQRDATVETQLRQEFGKDLNDPQWVRAHQLQIATRRLELRTEANFQDLHAAGVSLDKIQDQIELENSLAAAETKGAEAVRLVRLQHELAAIAKDKDTAAALQLIAATAGLASAEQKDKDSARLAELQQEIAATERLTAAQIGGAEAVRRAQLQNRIEEIKRTVPAQYQQEEIQKATQSSEAQRQQQVVSEALKSGISYRNRLSEIDQEIAALQQIKATQGDNLAVEISLRDLERERAKVFADQVQVLGSARDGLKAYFEEMATDGVSAAQEVHDALKTTFDSLNDQLAKLVAGQKVNWASLFQSISNDLTKSSLKNIEAQISGKVFPQIFGGSTQKHSPAAGVSTPPPQTSIGPLAGIHLPATNPNRPLPGATGLRDGQSAGTALFVTTTDATASANPAPSTSALPPSSSSPSSTATASENPIGHFFGGLGSNLLRLFGGYRAEGGTVSNTNAYVVGERGPELFVPANHGTIVPNHQIRQFHPDTYGIHLTGPFPKSQESATLKPSSNSSSSPSFSERMNAFAGTWDPTAFVPELKQSSKFFEGFANTSDVTSGPPVLKKYLIDVPREEGRQAVDSLEKGDVLGAFGHTIQSTPILPGFLSDVLGAQFKLGQRAAAEFHAGYYLEAAGHEIAAMVPLLGPNAVSISDDLLSSKKGDTTKGLGELAGFVTAGWLPFYGLGKSLSAAKSGVLDAAQAVKDFHALSPLELSNVLSDETGSAGPGSGFNRAARAKESYKPSTQLKQSIADRTETQLAKALGIPRTEGRLGTNAPFDLQNDRYGIEVKTLIDNGNDKITMHPESLRRKLAAAEEHGVKPYTVVADKRGPQTEYYYREGLGSFRIGAMNRVGSLRKLRSVLLDETGSLGPDSGFSHRIAARVFATPNDVSLVRDEAGNARWQMKAEAAPRQPAVALNADLAARGQIKGAPISRRELPETLYHVTANADAVETSGILLGQGTHGGLSAIAGNGEPFPGVSFTTSLEDARAIQRDLISRAGTTLERQADGSYRIKPRGIKILAIPSRNIPPGALITNPYPASDLLHEVRAYSDVPLYGARQSINAPHSTFEQSGGKILAFEPHEGASIPGDFLVVAVHPKGPGFDAGIAEMWRNKPLHSNAWPKDFEAKLSQQGFTPGDVVGYSLVRPDLDNPAQMSAVSTHVAETFRRQGVATALYNSAERAQSARVSGSSSSSSFSFAQMRPSLAMSDEAKAFWENRLGTFSSNAFADTIRSSPKTPASPESIASFFAALLPQLPLQQAPLAAGQRFASAAASSPKEKTLASLLENFGGFRAEGGNVSDDSAYMVGENGPELYVPKSDGYIVPNKKLGSFARLLAMQGGSTGKGMSETMAGLSESAPASPWQALDVATDTNAMLNRQDAARDQHPEAFNRTRSSLSVLSQSLATHAPSFASVLLGSAAAGANAALLHGLRGAGGGTASGIGSGLARAFPGGVMPPSPNISTNTGVYDPLTQSGTLDKIAALPKAPGSWGYGFRENGLPTLESLGISVGMELLSALFNRRKNLHHKPGQPFFLPGFNESGSSGMPFGGYRAFGGAVDPGYSYIVGEQGPELWTPAAGGGSILSHDTLTSITNNNRSQQKHAGGDIYIDARATDPAATDRKVRIGMEAAHDGAVRNSFKSYVDYKKRVPERLK